MQSTADLQHPQQGCVVADEGLEVSLPWASPVREPSVPVYGVAAASSFPDSSFPLSPLPEFRAENEDACPDSFPASSPLSWSAAAASSSSSSSSSSPASPVLADDGGTATGPRTSTSSAAPHVEALPTVRSHRHVDASRRSLELSSLRRLERLTGLAPDRLTKRGKLKKRSAANKLAVLEASADQLEQLQSLLQRLTTESNARERRLQQLTQRLHDLSSRQVQQNDGLLPVQAAARSICLLDNSQALYDTFFLRSPLAMLLLDLERPVEAGQLLDANESVAIHAVRTARHEPHCIRVLSPLLPSALCARSACVRAFCRATGWERPSAVWIRAEAETVRRELSTTDCREAEDGSRCRNEQLLVPPDHPSSAAGQSYHSIRQWPSSLQLIGELGAGQRQTCYCPWRCLWADGLLYEVQAMTWVCATATVRDDEGREWDRATRCITAFSMHEAVRVDPL